jgi:hypothetical protein
MQISVTYNPSDLNRSLDTFISKLTADAYAFAQANTPVKTGNARRGWVKGVKEIKNQVPYIGKLEAGASRQAPKGIIGPTLTQIKGKYK